MGIGRFLTSEDLAPFGDQDFRTVLPIKLLGLHRAGDRLVTRSGGCAPPSRRPVPGGPLALGSMKSNCAGSGACPVRILLDDLDVAEDVELVRTWDLAAVEFYTSASAPVQYRDTKSGCGVLLLWSKR